jgi:dephospho-CoA kinase
MVVIGVTGGLATGKSTVAGLFKKHGAKVLDADKIAHRLMKRGQPCFRPVVKRFGKDILTGGRIDRAKLSRIVFKDRTRLKALTRIVHPSVVREIRKEVIRVSRSRKQPVVIDAPLLIEAGLDRIVDWLIVVKAPRQVQLKRAGTRGGMTPNEALCRISTQMPLKEKIKRADAVIDNGANLLKTEKQVEAIWQRILRVKQQK